MLTSTLNSFSECKTLSCKSARRGCRNASYWDGSPVDVWTHANQAKLTVTGTRQAQAKCTVTAHLWY